MDTKEISQLITELFGGTFTKEFTQSDVERIMSQDNLWLFTHEEDGKTVAMTALYVVELFSRKIGVIEEVVTLNEYRNRGIGSNLVQCAIDKARELKVTCLELNVREDRPAVQRFYENLGFYDRKNKAMRMWINKQ